MSGIKWLITGYVVLLPLLSLVMDSRKVEWMTVSALPANHRIRESDLWYNSSLTTSEHTVDPAALIGKYLKQDIGADSPMTPSLVQDRPDINLDQNSILVSFPLDNQPMASHLDPGMAVSLCGGDGTKIDGTVMALVPQVPADPVDAVLLQVPLASASKLVRSPNSTPIILYPPAGKP
jgi:hypothetical protein